MVNKPRFQDTLKQATERLASDGLVVDMDETNRETSKSPVDLGDKKLTSVIGKVQKAMNLSGQYTQSHPRPNSHMSA